MRFFRTKLLPTLALTALASFGQAHADDADIYAIKFSDDGNYLVTGGYAGDKASYDNDFSGGIKVWDANNGTFIKGFGQLSNLNHLFGASYGRMGVPTLPISNFRDIIVSGSYPNGRIIVLPNSLGRFDTASATTAPSFIGGYFNLNSGDSQRLSLNRDESGNKNCGNTKSPKDYIGPMVASENGHYAAIVVNTCRLAPDKENGKGATRAEYDSSMYVMDLSTFAVTKYLHNVDAGVYALGIANNGKRVAYVGTHSFSVVDTDTLKTRVVEDYPNAEFKMPFQFSQLYFSGDASKLVSLRYVYDIDKGVETQLNWKNAALDAKASKITSMKVAPDMSYYLLVMQHSPLIQFDADGQSFVKEPRHDSVGIMDAKTGKMKLLEISDPDLAANYCVTDISRDSKRVAVGCLGGLLKTFDVATGKTLWENRNVGYKNRNVIPDHLKQVQNTPFQDTTTGGQSIAELPAMFWQMGDSTVQ
jgi:WD40 repeat protein